jgi:CIC family chloride channel protein
VSSSPQPRYAGARLSGNFWLVLLALLVGGSSGYAALGLMWLITQVQGLFFGFQHAQVYSGATNLDTLRVLLAPVLGGLAVGLAVRWLVPGGRNHGPADAMESVREGDGKLSLWAGLSSAATSALAIGSGASLGRYGPTVHLGASVAAWLGQRFARARAERHVLIGCGVAAGISASFNAPLAGVLFAHEVMLETFARRGFVAITIASVAGQVVARAHEAQFALVSLSEYHIGHNHEYLLFALVGIGGGLLAVAFIRGLEWAELAAGRVRVPTWCKPAIAGLVVGAIATRYPHVLGLGDEAIHDAVGQLFTLELLVVLIAAKLLAACLCRGFGFPGGVFGPALFLGTMLGSALGQALRLLEPGLVSSVPVYAVAGMGAVVSCVIGAPLATILIVFELTGSYALTTAVMIAVVTASMVASRVFPYSWFNLQLQRRGVDVHSGREVRIMRGRRVGELLDATPPRIPPRASATEARRLMLDHDVREILVVDADGELQGQLSLAEVVRAVDAGDGEQPVSGLATAPGLVLTVDDDLHTALQRLRYYMGLSVPVLESGGGARLAGVVYPSSVVGAYDDAVAQARAEERGTG